MKCILIILFQITCACSFLQAQVSYYNKTQDLEETINAYDDILIINQDSVLLSGFIRDTSNKRYNTYNYVKPISGDTIFTFRYGRDTMDIFGGKGMNISIKDENIYSCGALYQNGKQYANFLKFSLNGILIIDTLYNSEINWSGFESMLETDDGHFLILGTKEVSFENLDIWLVKMDTDGNILWENTYGSTENNGCSIIEKTSDGNYIISAGKEYDSGSDNYIIKIDPNGEVIWEKVIDNTIYYESSNGKPLLNGEVLLTGYNQYETNKSQAWVTKLDQFGNIIWEKTFEKSDFSIGLNTFILAKELENGNLVIIGKVNKEQDLFNPKGVMYCISKNGDSLWSRYYKIRNNDNYLTDLKILDNGDFLMAGYVFPDSPDNTEDGWLMRTNCLGYFEHPKDSIVFSGTESQLNANNYSTFFEYTTISWGDGQIDTLYEGNLQTINHLYPLPGNYSIETTTVACNDTIRNTIDYTANPPNLSNQNLSVFPNPNDGNFQVWLNSEEVFQIEVFDASGRIVSNYSNILLNTGFNLDLSSFESAMYFVKVRSENATLTERVIITK